MGGNHMAWLNSKDPVWKRAWKTYNGIIQRCTNPNRKKYRRYGGRGIKMMISKQDFIDWYTQKAHDRTDLTVDRINNDGHYEIGNIRLIPQSENSSKGNAISVQIGDRVFKSYTTAAKALHIPTETLHYQIKNNGHLKNGTIAIILGRTL